MTRKSEAYIEEELLTALLDGELFGERAREVQNAVFQSEELKSQVRGLGAISSQFRDAYKAELNSAWSNGQPDLWSNLERAIKQGLVPEQSILPSFSFKAPSFEAINFQKFRNYFQRNFVPAMGAFASACLVVVVGMIYLGDKQIESSIVVANNDNGQEIPMRDLLSELSSTPSRLRTPVRDQLIGQFGVGRSRPDSSTVHFVSSGQSGHAELPGQLFTEQLIDPDKLSVVPETSSSYIEWISSDRPFKFVKCRRDRSNPPVVWIGRNE